MGHGNQGTKYKLGNEEIPQDSEEKDLGVILTDDCKPSKQCAAAAKKAMNKMRVIKRTFESGTGYSAAGKGPEKGNKTHPKSEKQAI